MFIKRALSHYTEPIFSAFILANAERHVRSFFLSMYFLTLCVCPVPRHTGRRPVAPGGLGALRSAPSARYIVTASVARQLPLENECNEQQKTLGLTLEEAMRADVVGLPVYMDFDANNRIGTVISGFVNVEKQAWIINIALYVTLAFAADELLTGPWNAVAPSIRHVSRGKSIESFSIVTSSQFSGSRITRVRAQKMIV